ncbi:MAG: hypothetical protein LBV69_00215 [Bacteroidales bacterium]|jgi:hypothetical protein|nr:hypothetical protein [Bacteroidales bacterium]
MKKLRKYLKYCYQTFFICFLVFCFLYEYFPLYYRYISKLEVKENDVRDIKEEYSGNSIAYFHIVDFSEQFDVGLVRWNKDTINLCYIGEYNKQDIECLENYILLINDLLKDKIVLRLRDINNSKLNNTQIKILYMPENFKLHNVNAQGETSPFFNGFTNEIKEAVIFVTNHENQKRRNKIVIHELLHALGFMGHPNSMWYADSFLSYESFTVDSMPCYEAEALKLLYDKRIPNHYSKEKSHKQFLPIKVYFDDLELYFNPL